MEPIDSLPIFETPLFVYADTENRCFEIYDNINDRVASDIEDIEQAKMFAAAPQMYAALQAVCSLVENHICTKECNRCIIGEALRKAHGENEQEQQNLCKTCANRAGVILNATWNQYTGDVRRNPKWQCGITHKCENKTECENYRKDTP